MSADSSDELPVKPNPQQRRLEDELERSTEPGWVAERLALPHLDDPPSTNGLSETPEPPDEAWASVQMAWPHLSKAHKDIIAVVASALAVERSKAAKP